MIAMLVVLVAVGFLLTVIPMDSRIRTVVVVILVVLAVLMLLRIAGLA